MKLYKYCPPDRIDVLQSARIRLTPPGYLNDPFELFPTVAGVVPDGVEFLGKLLIQQVTENPDEVLRIAEVELAKALPPGFNVAIFRPMIREQIAKMDLGELLATVPPIVQGLNEAATRQGWDRLRDGFDKQVGILSLTQNPRSLLMWAHYAAAHRGFLVELDGSHPFFDQRTEPEDPVRHVRPVKYQDSRPAIHYYEPDADPIEFGMRMCAVVFLTKAREWSYEQEWRLLLPLDNAAIVHHGPEPIHLFDLPREAVTGIVLGARVDPQLERAVGALLAEPHWRHIKVSKARVSRESFSIDITPVDTGILTLGEAVEQTGQ